MIFPEIQQDCIAIFRKQKLSFPKPFLMRLLSPLFLVLLLSCEAEAQVSTMSVIEGTWAEGLHQYFSAQAQEGFSGSVWISKGGKTILKGGYGYANREKQLPFTEHTISTIGSITKPLTATAIALLQEQGRLHVDNRMDQYIPDLPPKLAAITLHQLLLHTSGLGNIMVNNDFKIISKEDFVERLKKETLRFESGSQSEYSNIGFSVLGYVIEEVTGKSYEDFMQETFFQPMGMNHTGYTAHEWHDDSVAIGYRNKRAFGTVHHRLKEMDGHYWNLIGNGGIHMNLDDMYTWYQAMSKSHPILTDSVKALLLRPHIKCNENSIRCHQGYAWVVVTDPEGKQPESITHNGGNGVLFAEYWWFLEEDIFIGMQSNNSRFAAENVLRPIRRALVAGEKEPVPEGKD